jgi:plastocyanin
VVRVARGTKLAGTLLAALTVVAFSACSSASSSAGGTSAPAATVNAAGTALVEIAKDNSFSPTSFLVPAGQAVTLTLQNQGSAVHNWHVTDVKDAAGKDIATPLTDGKRTSSVTFSITKPGTYHFRCDVHPDDMKGTLVVQ